MAPLSSIFSDSTPDVLSLSYIRSILQRLEDTILFQLIERGQNAHNEAMYRPGAFKELEEKEGWTKSWVEWFLKETESSHAKCRRWQAPDEYPFTDESLLPQPILPPIEYPEVLYKAAIVTVNDQIYKHYRDELVPALTKRFGPVSVWGVVDDERRLIRALIFNIYARRTQMTSNMEVRRSEIQMRWQHCQREFTLVSTTSYYHEVFFTRSCLIPLSPFSTRHVCIRIKIPI
jgi:monofunctional chorismate mutase